MLDAKILHTRTQEVLKQRKEALLQRELDIVEPKVKEAAENGKFSIWIKINLSEVTCEHLEKNGFYVQNVIDQVDGERRVLISWDITEE